VLQPGARNSLAVEQGLLLLDLHCLDWNPWLKAIRGAAAAAASRLESVVKSDPRCCCCCFCCDRSGAESRLLQPRRPAWPWQAENRTCGASDATAAWAKPRTSCGTPTQDAPPSGQRTIEPGLAARQPHIMKALVRLHGRNGVPCGNCHARALAEHICTMKTACVMWRVVKEMQFCVDR
jgi:hypothetical protein